MNVRTRLLVTWTLSIVLIKVIMLEQSGPRRTCLSSSINWGKQKKFHEEIVKSITHNHMRILGDEETKTILSNPHCFSFLNYTEKASSSTQKIRPVTNSSSPHPNESINHRLPIRPNLLNSMKKVFMTFLINPYVAHEDLTRCYRSMRTCDKSNCMRLMSYPLDPLDPKNIYFIVLLLERATYGDS